MVLLSQDTNGISPSVALGSRLEFMLWDSSTAQHSTAHVGRVKHRDAAVLALPQTLSQLCCH